MKRYIREVVIPEYAKNFHKGLSAEDIKFYGKIHFDRDRSDNELNMHCHLIVNRKDQSNKKKLSPLTNHKNTKKGAIKGGFDRTNLFKQTEQGFDKLFNYDRPITESFEYYNTMKNGNISDQLKMQEKTISQPPANQQNIASNERKKEQAVNQGSDLGVSSALGILTPEQGNNEELPIKRPKKKKKPKRGFRR